MEYLSRTDIITHGHIIPVLIYRGKGKSIKIYYAYGFYQLILPKTRFNSDQDFIERGLALCRKIRVNLVGILPFDNDYCYVRGHRYNVIMRTKHSDFPDTLAFFSENTYLKYLKSEALTYFTERVNYWKEIMGLGHIDYKIKVVDVFSYMGQNRYTTNSLSFSYHLLAFETYYLDSVIVHELAHTLVHNHNQKFYNVVLKFLPNYEHLIKCVKRGVFNGDLL